MKSTAKPPSNPRRPRRIRQKTSRYSDSNPSLLCEIGKKRDESHSPSIEKGNPSDGRARSRKRHRPEDNDGNGMQSLQKKEEDDCDRRGTIRSHKVTVAPVILSLQEATSKKSHATLSVVDLFLQGKRHSGLSSKIRNRWKILTPQWNDMALKEFYHSSDSKFLGITEQHKIPPICDDDNDSEIDVLSSTNENGPKSNEESLMVTSSANHEGNSTTEKKNDKKDAIHPPSPGPVTAEIHRSIRVIDPSAVPLDPVCSCLAVSSSATYMAVGDSSGYVTVYTTHPRIVAVSRIETASSKRRHAESGEFTRKPRIQQTSRAKKKVTTSKKTGSRKITETAQRFRQCFGHHPAPRTGSERNMSVAGGNLYAVESLAFFQHNLAVSTKFEIELHNLTSHGTSSSSLMWSMDTAECWRAGPAMSLSIHPKRGVLAGFFHAYTSSHFAEQSDCLDHPYPPSPMALASPHNKNLTKIVPIDTMTSSVSGDRNDEHSQKEECAPLRLGIAAVGIWDANTIHSMNKSYMYINATVLMDSSSSSSSTKNNSNNKTTQKEKPTDQQQQPCQEIQQIMKVDSDTMRVIYKNTIPNKINATKILSTEVLRQSDNGQYILAASTKGIRMFASSDLSLLKIMGEDLTLHGHIFTWQDCFLIYEDHRDSTFHHKVDSTTQDDHLKGSLIEREDELYHRENVVGGDSKRTQSSTYHKHKTCYVVGVPHAFRKPHEMRDTLYLWRLDTKQQHVDETFKDRHHVVEEIKLPTLTLKIPFNSEGVQNVFWKHDKFILSTQKGRCFEMSQKFCSSWAGKMFPPGFLICEENMEYIEDEDSYDVVVKVEKPSDNVGHKLDFAIDGDEEECEDLLLESIVMNESDEPIDVTTTDADDADLLFVPCHPELDKQREIYHQQIEVNIQSIPDVDVGDCSLIFSMLPPIPELPALRAKKMKFARNEDNSVSENSKDNKKSNPRLKRKPNSIEALLQSSIDEKIRHEMIRRQCWSSGRGSRCDGNNGYCDDVGENATENICKACMGRLTIHTCGARDIPVDQEMLAKLLKKDEEAREEEKRKEEQQKKELAEAKRREKNRLRRQRDAEKREVEKAKARKKKEEEEEDIRLKKELKKREEEQKRKEKKEAEEQKRKEKRQAEEDRRIKKKREEEERKLQQKKKDEEKRLQQIKKEEEKKLQQIKKEEEKKLQQKKKEEEKQRKEEQKKLQQKIKEEERKQQKESLRIKREQEKSLKRMKALEEKKIAKQQAAEKKNLKTQKTGDTRPSNEEVHDTLDSLILLLETNSDDDISMNNDDDLIYNGQRNVESMANSINETSSVFNKRNSIKSSTEISNVQHQRVIHNTIHGPDLSLLSLAATNNTISQEQDHFVPLNHNISPSFSDQKMTTNQNHIAQNTSNEVLPCFDDQKNTEFFNSVNPSVSYQNSMKLMSEKKSIHNESCGTMPYFDEKKNKEFSNLFNSHNGSYENSTKHAFQRSSIQKAATIDALSQNCLNHQETSHIQVVSHMLNTQNNPLRHPNRILQKHEHQQVPQSSKKQPAHLHLNGKKHQHVKPTNTFHQHQKTTVCKPPNCPTNLHSMAPQSSAHPPRYNPVAATFYQVSSTKTIPQRNGGICQYYQNSSNMHHLQPPLSQNIPNRDCISNDFPKHEYLSGIAYTSSTKDRNMHPTSVLNDMNGISYNNRFQDHKQNHQHIMCSNSGAKMSQLTVPQSKDVRSFHVNDNAHMQYITTNHNNRRDNQSQSTANTGMQNEPMFRPLNSTTDHAQQRIPHHQSYPSNQNYNHNYDGT